jgi:hypothetical protein
VSDQPIGGDPAEVERAAATFSGLNGSMGNAQNLLKRTQAWTTGHDAWAGPAGEAFNALLGEAVTDFQSVIHLTAELAINVRAYADALLTAQRAWARAEDDRRAAKHAGDASAMATAEHAMVYAQDAVDGAAAKLLSVLSTLPALPTHSWTTAPIPRQKRIRQPGRERNKGSFVGSWVPEIGSLYAGKGPSLKDIQQGDTGDCFFLAAVASVLRVNPSAIKKLIHDNGNGTYTVTFADGKKETVNAASMQFTALSFPDGNYGPAGASVPVSAAGVPVLWTLILEKAYAERRRGYSVINQGGNPGEVWKLLQPDASPRYYDVTTMTDQQTASTITTALHDHTPITAGSDTLTNNALARHLNVVGDHAYYVTGYDAHTGTVTLGNPWGTDPTLTPKHLTMNEFRQLFGEIEVARPLG